MDDFKGNLGLLYTRRYYDGLSAKDFTSDAKAQKSYYEGINRKLESQSKWIVNVKPILEGDKRFCGFFALTRYPGLITGIGLSHACNHTGELKFGMAFDHTTGMPYLPASSIKGVLRSVFPSGDSETDNQRAAFVADMLKEPKLDVESVKQLAIEIFGSEQGNIKNHIKGKDVFFDAFPVECGESGMLKIDYITPHTKGEFLEPDPISFMCIAPNVKFHFSFQLTTTEIGDITIDRDIKCDLFKKILESIGIGAKTNVGYGRLTVL